MTDLTVTCTTYNSCGDGIFLYDTAAGTETIFRRTGSATCTGGTDNVARGPVGISKDGKVIATAASSPSSAPSWYLSGSSWNNMSVSGATDYFGGNLLLSGDGFRAFCGITSSTTLHIMVANAGRTAWTSNESVTIVGNFTDDNLFSFKGQSCGYNPRVNISVNDDGDVLAFSDAGWNAHSDSGITIYGGVAIFTRSGSTWSFQQLLQYDTDVTTDYSGWAAAGGTYATLGESVQVSADGSTIVVTAVEHYQTGDAMTAVYTFTLSGGTWTQSSAIRYPCEQDTPWGLRVACSSDASTIVQFFGGQPNRTPPVGCPGGNYTAARILVFSGGGLVQTLFPNVDTSHLLDGTCSLAVSNDGSTFAMGLYPYPNIGRVFVYQGGAGGFTPIRVITPSESSAYDEFGSVVALTSTGDQLLAGNCHLCQPATTDGSPASPQTFSMSSWVVDGVTVAKGDKFILTWSDGSQGNTSGTFFERVGNKMVPWERTESGGSWFIVGEGSPPDGDVNGGRMFYTENGVNNDYNLLPGWVEDGCSMGCSRGMVWEGQWTGGTTYYVADVNGQCNSSVVFNGGSSYIAITEHTSGTAPGSPPGSPIGYPADEPGYGSSWTTYWELVADGPGTTGAKGDKGDRGVCGLGFEWDAAWTTATAYTAQNNSGSPCTQASTVSHNDVVYVCIQSHTSGASTEPGIGGSWTSYWDTFVTGGGSGTVVWRGYWQASVSYAEDDLVTHDGTSYMCTVSHTSDVSNEPDQTFDYEPGGSYWMVVSTGTDPATLSDLIDTTTSWFDGVVDWVTDMPNWGLEDWVTALAVGGGLIWAGTQLNDMFNATPSGSGGTPADSRYTGDDCYAGTFTAPSLQEVVASICDWAGVTDYDVSELSGSPGYYPVNFTIGQLASGRSILEMLSLVYFFDMVNSSGTLKFVPRSSQSSVKSLTVDEDLGWSRDGNRPPAPYTIRRYQGKDLPKSVSLTYLSEGAGYNTMVQTATLETFTEGNDVHIEVPVLLSEDAALEVVERGIVNAHVERTTYTFTTNWNHLDLEPGDVITVDDLGDLRIIRIDEERDDGLLTFVCVDATQNTTNYEPSGIPSMPAPTYSDTPAVVGYSAGLILEIPPMEGTDQDDPHMVIAPHGFGASGWAGCAIYVSDDGGSSYDLFANASSEATWGRVASATSAPVSDVAAYWDELTTIQVELKTGTLSSVTEAQVFAGQNWAMVGSEMIGFRNASLVTGTTYNLTGLLRGMKGTEVHYDDHTSDEAFVLIDSALIRFPYDLNTKDVARKFKFVTFGSDISKATAYDAQPNTVSIRPWKVANLVATRNGSPNGDWNISWTARNQFDGGWVNGGPTVKPYKFGGYVVQILSDASPTVAVRTQIQQVDTFTYTEAMQSADWGSPIPNNITVRVAQVDLRIGPGYNDTQTF